MLFLPGDLGNPRDATYEAFLASCAKRYGTVFLVLGNHEFYGSSIKCTVDGVREICARHHNVILLHNETHDIPGTGIRIAGTTLWSRVDEAQKDAVECFIADYRRIEDWYVERNNAMHLECVQWLVREAERARVDGVRLVVMTHHAPYTKSGHPRHWGLPLSSAFETDLTWLIHANPHILAWMHGHTHYSGVRTICKTMVISNQYGFPWERALGKEHDAFNPAMEIAGLWEG
jgi:predicted phosphohydrolase